MKNWPIKSLSMIIFCFMVVACGGGGGTSTGTTDISRSDTKSAVGNSDSEVQLSWYIPDSREDGSDLEVYEIDGYRIYYSTTDTSIDEGESIEVNDPQITDYSITGLPSGDYRLAISAIDTQGLESRRSSEIIANIP